MENEQNAAVFSVSDVNGMVRDAIEGTFQPFWISGEVGNLTIHRSGHVYLTLKDASSQIRAVYFNGAAFCRSVNLCEGTKIEAYGKLTVYSARGEYQMSLRSVRPFGVGELQMKFEDLKRRLAQEGVFDPARKKQIPFQPKRIGVISSPSGAALKDFIRIARARFPGLFLKVCPAPVQGAGAERKLALGIRFFNRTNSVDVIVLTRGGGSLEDLWPFNEEVLAREIAASHIPVVSAVGHEIDFTISDFAADLRAPTPSGAAEMIIPDRNTLLRQLDSVRSRMATTLSLHWERANSRLNAVRRSRAFLDLGYQIEERMQRIDASMENASALLTRTVERAEERLARAQSVLKAYNPYGVLGRGYAILTTKDGHVVTSKEPVKRGDALRVRVADGEIPVTAD